MMESNIEMYDEYAIELTSKRLFDLYATENGIFQNEIEETFYQILINDELPEQVLCKIFCMDIMQDYILLENYTEESMLNFKLKWEDEKKKIANKIFPINNFFIECNIDEFILTFKSFEDLHNQELINQIKHNQELLKFIIDEIECSELYFQFQKLNSKWIYMIRIDPHFFIEFSNKLLTFNLSILTNTLERSEVGNVLESLKGVYANEFNGFIPYMAGFVSYLIKSGRFIQFDNVIESTEELLAEHAIDKLETFHKNIEKAKNKRQTLIDITPQQTLSIEAAAVKECKVILQHQEIGLLHYYDELPLNDNNAQRIAEKYGQGSGVTLMKHYRAVKNSQSQRRNHKHAKKYLETVIPLLTKKEGIEKAKQDLANVKIHKQ